MGGAGTVLDLWESSVATESDTVFVRYGERAVTRAEADVRVRRLAAAWSGIGVRAGDRVAVQLQNVPELVDAVLTAWRLGAVVVPVNPMYRERELEHVLTDSGARLLVHDAATAELVAPAAAAAGVAAIWTDQDVADAADAPGAVDGAAGIARPLAEDPALITYTSGTTGPAKGAVASHANVLAGALVYRDQIGVGAGSVILGVAPICHVTGMIGHLAVAVAGSGELVLMGRFDPARAIELIESARVTFTIGALTAYLAMLAEAARRQSDFSSLRALYSGGAPVVPAVAAEVEKVFGVPLGNAYGMTETTSICHLTTLGEQAPVDPASGALSIGRPVPGTSAWIVDDDGRRLGPGETGELVVRGPGVVSGYWNNPEASAEALLDGAIRTGDVALVDDHGWYYIVDRRKDQINASGFKVWPREVEDVLYQHPAVAEAAVFGVPDPYRGETVVAAVVPRAGHQVDPEELIAFVRARLAPYKSPRRVRILDQLPTTSSGKILRRVLREKEETAHA
ncbi:class I adenylate-forming enzyme family protein [Nocardioides sp.]|uniref:class I adenylate-forming enzyme family protein n=1 Tax=Nocardioides sp. TaxID=35761 RepID=UPI0039E356FB